MFFFFNDTATTEIYTLSLHDALPICAALDRILMGFERSMTREEGLPRRPWFKHQIYAPGFYTGYGVKTIPGDRKSTRLNSSHANISYAVFCLKKKKTKYYLDISVLHA